MIKLRKINQEGNALIVTLLVISVLASIAFTTSRLAISELRQTTQLEDSEMAYQSAEAGIESGLLLFRYNQDVELPNSNVTELDNVFFRYNLTDGVEISNTQEMDPNKQYYDLKIWHRNNENVEIVKSRACSQKYFDEGKCVSVDNQYFNSDYVDGVDEEGILSGYVIPAISQDNFVEYDMSGLSSTSDIYLKWRFTHNVLGSNRDKLKLQYIPRDNEGDNILSNLGTDLARMMSGAKYAFSYDKSENSGNLSLNLPIKNISTSDGLKNANKIRIKPSGENILTYSITLNTSNTTQNMDSKYSYIEATGYYGGSQRKLKIKIDRNTGSSISPVDFVLVQGE